MLLLEFVPALKKTTLFPVHKRHQPLPFQVREPAEIIGDDVVILTAWTCHDHNALVISLLGDLLHGPSRANLHETHTHTYSYKLKK